MDQGEQKVAIGLGSNLEPRRESMRRAAGWLARAPGCRLLAVSSLYCSSAWRCEAGAADFLNAVLLLETAKSPGAMLQITQDFEKRAGGPRHRCGDSDRPYLSRLLDLDILLMGEIEVDSADLVVPHPQLCHREFVLRPLCEIAPDWRVPPDAKTIRSLLDDLKLESPDCRQVEGPGWASPG